MFIAITLVFVLGYAAIALEHPLRLDKAASALFTAVICWTLFALGYDQLFPEATEPAHPIVEELLVHHLGEISGILFFLLGAMTIVELVDAHDGFSLITDKIRTTSKSKLLIILSVVTFFMSAVLDNLTTAIVMATLLRKLISNKNDLWLFAGMVIIAANAGGAWSPIGDVTTIMLWIGGQISAPNIVVSLFIPSIFCLAVPLLILSTRMKGRIDRPVKLPESERGGVSEKDKKIVLFLGVGALLFVPVFKSVTHLPPYLGILLGLSVLWAITEFIHRKKDGDIRKPLSIAGVIRRIDTPSILFFLGILLAVAVLQSAGHLGLLAQNLDRSIGDIWIINVLIGFLSSIVDNVPLVAGAMGMYDMATYPQDHVFWELLAYCAGTGGSVLIIGSAAGVAIMSILHIDFIWYLKRVSILAISGYLSGVLVFWLMKTFL